MVALTLGKYGVDVDFTGAVGEDEQAKRIRELFDSYQVKTQYIQTVYTEKTAVSYKIYNSKSNKFTSVSELANKLFLTKYKYEFIPEVVIMDDKDHDANLAAINNYPNSLLIYIGEKFTKDSKVYCNKCNYVISNLEFASQATGVTEGLNKNKTIVNLFQKFIDLYNTNLIIKLDNFDLLYCLNDEVRLIKNINKTIANKEHVYYSLLVYFMINNYNTENAIKLTNKVMLNSKSEIDMVDNIPDYNDIENAIKEFESMNIPNETDNVIKENNVEPVEQLETKQVAEGVENVSEIKEVVVTPVVENVVEEPKQEQVEPIVETVQTIETIEPAVPVLEQIETPVMEQNTNVETLSEVDVPKPVEEITIPQQNNNEIEVPVLETPVQNPNNNQNIDNNGVNNG